jgi:hypothetical protein
MHIPESTGDIAEHVLAWHKNDGEHRYQQIDDLISSALEPT